MIAAFIFKDQGLTKVNNYCSHYMYPIPLLTMSPPNSNKRETTDPMATSL